MSFHVSSWSIKNPVPTIVMFLILGIVGFFSFIRLGIDEIPNIDIPVVIVTVTQPGAGPAELETQVTKKIEDTVAALGDIDDIRSTITDGTSTTLVNFVLGTDTNQATNDVRNSIAEIRSSLPQDINDPIVKRLEFSGGSVMTYAVVSDKFSVEELSDLVDRKISRRLVNVPGVGQIERLGGVDRAIRVDLDPNRLKAFGITATQVNDQIRNFNINLPGGRSKIGGGEQNVRTLGSAKTVEDLKNYRIILPSRDTVTLSSLGEVSDSFADREKSAFLNSKPVVAFSVLRSPGSTLVSVEEGVREAVKNLDLPEDVKLSLIFTRADAIRASYQSTIYTLIIGCILTMITVWIFLRDWRVTLITGLALPLSIIPTFWVMKALGYTLDSMSLLGLALAIGNLVDDAICMIENIDQHLQMGKKPFQAAMDGAREIGLAVVATTATIVAVFLPVAFMGGIPGQFFQPFGVTVSVSTMFSTLVATTMTPMLSAYLLKPKNNSSDLALTPLNPSPPLYPPLLNGEKGKTTETPETTKTPSPYEGEGWGGVYSSSSENQGKTASRERISQSQNQNRPQPYRTLLSWALRHKITTLFIAVAFFIASLQLIPFLPKGLTNNGDTGVSTVMIELPPGSRLSDTEAIMQQTTQVLLENKAVESVLAKADEVNSAIAYVNLLPKEERDLSQKQFEQQMREMLPKIPGARIAFRNQGPWRKW